MTVRSALRAGFVLSSLPVLAAPAFAQTEVTAKDFDDGHGGHQSAIWKDGRPYWYSDYAAKTPPPKRPPEKKPPAEAKPDAEKPEAQSEPPGDGQPADRSPAGDSGPSDAPSTPSSGSGGGGSDAGSSASKGSAAAGSHGRASARASAGMKGMASALKAMGPGDAGAIGAGGRAAAAGAAALPAPPKPAAASGTEILAASYGSDAAAMARLGLRMGTGPDGRPAIVDSSGRLATPAQLEALRRENPHALERRPDFFGVIPREQYAGLVAARTSPSGGSNPAFQDIGLTAGNRDFVWSKSCTKGLDSCNPLAAGKDEGHYDKNAEVSPETLKKVADATEKDKGEDPEINKLYEAMKETLKEMDRKEAEQAGGAPRDVLPAARAAADGLERRIDDDVAPAVTAGVAPVAAGPALAPSPGFSFTRLFRRERPQEARRGQASEDVPDEAPRRRVTLIAWLFLAAATALFAFKRRSSASS